MRSALLLLLLASASPAFAAIDPSDSEERSARLEERAERAERERPERSEPPIRMERVQREERAPREERQERSQEPRRGGFGLADMLRGNREPAAGDDAPAPRREDRAARAGREERGDSVRDWRMRDRGVTGAPTLAQEGDGAVPESMGDWRRRQLDRLADGGNADGRIPPAISRVPREGTQPPPARHARETTTRHNWRGDWRHDRRYDWRSHRNRNRSRFHLGIYIDPFGWRYRPYSIGWRMWPHHYRSSYWLNDPWSYRLPYAPAGYRWIRYYDDALLVDTWSGEVVDVIRYFFW